MSVCIYAYRAGAGASDPLAAVLLLARPRLGVMLAVAISTGDVVLKVGGGVTRGVQHDVFIAQGAFLGFSW